MPRYSQAFKEQLVQKLVSPEGPTLAKLSLETGISGPSLRAWKRQFEQSGGVCQASCPKYSCCKLSFLLLGADFFGWVEPDHIVWSFLLTLQSQ